MGYLQGALFYRSIAHDEKMTIWFSINRVLTKVINLGVEEIVAGNKVVTVLLKRLN